MTRIFPKSRVVAIDYYKPVLSGLQQAYQFCKRSRIPFNTKDGLKVSFHYCLAEMMKVYRTTRTPFQKAIVIHPNAKSPFVREYVKTHLKTLMKGLPFPWCEVSSWNSPDLETAVLHCTENLQPVDKKVQRFLQSYSLRELAKRRKQKRDLPFGSMNEFPVKKDDDGSAVPVVSDDFPENSI